MKSNMAYRRFRHMGKDKVAMDFAFEKRRPFPLDKM